MTLEEKKARAEEVLPFLSRMFEGRATFKVMEQPRSNEVGVVIRMFVPGASLVPGGYITDDLNDLSAWQLALVMGRQFKEALDRMDQMDLSESLPAFDRESVLKNVVLQALNPVNSAELLNGAVWYEFLDLAAVFRLPLKVQKGTFVSTVISPDTLEELEISMEELQEAARRNTVQNLGVELVNSRAAGARQMQGKSWTPGPFEKVKMDKPGLYTLTNHAHINGAALIFVPDLLEAVGKKAGTDFYVMPTSIHELMIAKKDGRSSRNRLRDILYKGNRNPQIITPEDVLSDSLYLYSRERKALKIV